MLWKKQNPRFHSLDRIDCQRCGLVGAEYEEREDDREDAAADEVGLRQLGEHGEWGAKAEKVRPVVFDVGESLVQLPAHVDPLVLERVQRVKEARVEEAEEGAGVLAGQHIGQHRLDEEEGLHEQTEQRVCDEFAEVGEHLGPALAKLVGRVGNVLEPQAVDDLAEDEQRHHPEHAEEEAEEGLHPAPDDGPNARLVGEDARQHVLERGQHQVLEEGDSQPEDASVQCTAL